MAFHPVVEDGKLVHDTETPLWFIWPSSRILKGRVTEMFVPGHFVFEGFEAGESFMAAVVPEDLFASEAEAIEALQSELESRREPE